MKKQKLILILMCMSLSIAVLLTAFISHAEADSVGESAPHFILKDLDENDVSLSSFKGRPVFLNFWTTW